MPISAYAGSGQPDPPLWIVPKSAATAIASVTIHFDTSYHVIACTFSPNVEKFRQSNSSTTVVDFLFFA